MWSIVNTCSVTATADQGARQTIRRIARENPAGAHRRHRLLRDARAGRSRRRCPNVVRVVPNDDKLDSAARRLARRCAMTTAERFGDGDGPCGAPIAPGVAGRTAFTLRVQTGCEERCAYCIIPTTRGAARSLPIDAVVARGRARRAAGFTGDRADRRAPRIVRPRSRAGSRRCCDLLRALDASRGRRGCFASARSSRWTARRRSSIWSRQRRPLRAALPPAAAARQRSHAARDAPAVHARRLPPARRRHRRTPAARVDRLGHDRRVSRARPTTTSPRTRRLPAVVAADAPARVPVLRSAGHGGVEHGATRCRARSIRDRGAPAARDRRELRGVSASRRSAPSDRA